MMHCGEETGRLTPTGQISDDEGHGFDGAKLRLLQLDGLGWIRCVLDIIVRSK